MNPPPDDSAERAGLEHLADVGEVAGPLAHEFSNFLNVLLLQVSLMEMILPEDQRADLIEVRRQGERAARLVNHFHEYRKRHAAEPGAVDLPVVVRTVLDELSETSSVVFNAGNEPLLIVGMLSDIKRLVRFLVSNALRAGNRVEIHASLEEKRVVLMVEDNGPAPSDEALMHLFETSHEGREGVDVLELAACRSLARRLNATINASVREEGGVSVQVSFKRVGAA